MSGYLGADLLARVPGDLERVGDVVVHGPVRKQLEVLEDHADVATVERDLLARDRRKVAAGDADRAVGGLELLDQKPHHGRLSGAGGADQEDEVLAVDGEGRLVEPEGAGAVLLRDSAELDHGVLAGIRSWSLEISGLSGIGADSVGAGRLPTAAGSGICIRHRVGSA